MCFHFALLSWYRTTIMPNKLICLGSWRLTFKVYGSKAQINHFKGPFSFSNSSELPSMRLDQKWSFVTGGICLNGFRDQINMSIYWLKVLKLLHYIGIRGWPLNFMTDWNLLYYMDPTLCSRMPRMRHPFFDFTRMASLSPRLGAVWRHFLLLSSQEKENRIASKSIRGNCR